MRRLTAAFFMIGILSLCCACNAVTPGPCTTRKMAGVGTAPAQQHTEAETVTAPETTVPETSAEAVTEAETPEAPQGKTMRTTADLTIRTGPGTDYEAVGEIPEGGTILVLDNSGRWSLVYYEGEQYYMSSKYLEDVE